MEKLFNLCYNKIKKKGNKNKMENNLLQKLIEIEQRTINNSKIIEKHEIKLHDIHELTLSIKELAIETKNIRKDINKIDNRLIELEKKPIKNWEKFIWIIISSLITLILGFLFGHIF